MKNIFSIILLLLAYTLPAQTFSFTEIPYSEPDIISPGRGAEQWGNGSAAIPNPTSTGVTMSLDKYDRFQWVQLQGIGADSNTYNWNFFDNYFKDVIPRRQKWSFGVMTCYDDPPSNWRTVYDGQQISYPPFLHDLMKSNPDPNMRPWNNGGQWVPNWNNPDFLRHVRKLNEALYNRIMTQSYQGVPFRKVIFTIDIRIYGQYGEWHHGGIANWNDYPAHIRPTAASLKKIIDHHTQVFHHWPLLALIAGFDGGMAFNPPTVFIPLPEVADYLLKASNAWGPVGCRRDQWLTTHDYLKRLLEFNTRSYMGGETFGSQFLRKWKDAPMTGEPEPGAADYLGVPSQVMEQVLLYHASSIGNGNYPFPPSDEGIRTRIRELFKRTGYRLILTGGNALVGGNFRINLNWQNIGVAPTYEFWQVQYILRNGAGSQVWTGNSSFQLKKFLPTTAPVTATDIFSLPAVAAGNYRLYVKIVDTADYRAPLPLAIRGRESDGSYLLGNVTFTGGSTNQPPVANAGPNQSITAPTSSASLSGTSSSDPDGSISAYLWSQVSGPNTATITTATASTTDVTGLIPGTYVFNLRVTDNNSAVGNDQVQITVNGNTPPVANAGPNQTTTLPKDSVNLSGSGSTDNAGITAYAWSKITGPVSYTIVTPDNVTTKVTGLEAGIYNFRLTVTDAGGLTHSDDVRITVVDPNIPPVANAGPNQSITLPTSSVTLEGDLSTDDVGIASYQWSKVGGPTSYTITDPTSDSTTVTGLVAGIYIFRLTVFDGAGLSHSDDVQITVNTNNLAPVANAGTNQEITLPTSSVNLSGSGSSDDVGIVSYAWSKVSGGSATITSPSSMNTTVTGLAKGVYQFRLIVTDGSGATSNDEVQITVLAAPNTGPVADAGENQSITLPTNSVTVDGSSSSDDDGISTYGWTKISGGSATITSASSASTLISGLAAGTYVFRLTVTDSGGLTATDDITIVVFQAANNSPVAEAGNPQNITLPTNSVTVNGSGSSDDNGIVSYQWARVSGTGVPVIVSPNSASTSINNLSAGIHTFRLTVTDADGLTDTDDIQITVNQAAAKPSSDPSHKFFRWLWKFLSRF